MPVKHNTWIVFYLRDQWSQEKKSCQSVSFDRTLNTKINREQSDR